MTEKVSSLTTLHDISYYFDLPGDTNDELVTVRFIDFGFTEIHPLSHLRELDASFLQIPCLSIHCRLHGVCDDEIDYL